MMKGFGTRALSGITIGMGSSPVGSSGTRIAVGIVLISGIEIGIGKSPVG